MEKQWAKLHHLLQSHLSDAAAKNPRFSLRALAKKLEISPSHLSRVLRGEKKFSYQMTLRLVRELDLSSSQSELILKNFETVKKDSIKQSQDDRASKVLDFEHFRMIADWYHFPILELIRTKDFQSDEKWISQRMGLPLAVVIDALNRLEALGYIERKKKKISLSQAEIFKTSDDLKNVAIRKHHTQMLQKSLEALEEQDVLKREFRSLNLNFNPEDLEDAKKMIREFTKKFNKSFSKNSGKEVYQMNLQFFSMTKEIL